MKNPLLILTLIICLFLTSCANTNFYNGLNSSSPYLRTSAFIISSAVFEETVSKEDRDKRAIKVYAVAEIIEQMASAETPPTPEKFAESISVLLPDKDYFGDLATGLILLYGDFYSIHPPSDNTKILLNSLSRIASGIKASASRYRE